MKYLLIALIGILLSCKTSETLKTSNLDHTYETWLSEPAFEVKCTVAHPFVTSELSQIANSTLLGSGNTANRINLQGRGDFLRISEGVVVTDMSYYGTQQFAVSNTGSSGIILNGPVEDYELAYNQKKSSTHISFKASHELEHYEFDITLYASGNCTIDVNSAKRNFIKYDGVMEVYVEE
jgi:hypothetical protein